MLLNPLTGMGVMLSPEPDAGGGAAPAESATTEAAAPTNTETQPAAKTQAQIDTAAQQYLAKIGVDPESLGETGLKAFTAAFTDRGTAIRDGNAKETALKTERRAKEAAEAKLNEINSAKFLEGEATPEKLQALYEQSQSTQKGLSTLKSRVGMLVDAGLVPAEIAEFIDAPADADPVQLGLKVESIRKKATPAEITEEAAIKFLAERQGVRADAAPAGGKPPSEADQAKALLDQYRTVKNPQTALADQWVRETSGRK